MRLKSLFLATLLLALSSCDPPADPAYQVVSDPNNSLAFFLTAPGGAALKIDSTGWGTNWAWVSVSTQNHAPGDDLNAAATITFNKDAGEIVDLNLHAHASGKTILMEYTTKAPKDIPLTMIAATINAAEGGSAKATIATVDGKETAIQLPAGANLFSQVKGISFSGDKWGPVNLAINPPVDVGVDGQLRLMLADKVATAGEKKITLTWTFPSGGGDVPLIHKPADLAKFAPEVVTPDWFPYQPKWNVGTSPISMDSWRQAAGAHGGVLQKGDHFELADGTPVKFFGTNLSYAMSAPEKADADFTAARFAKYGINAVRMHKFTGSGWEGIGDENDALKMKPEGLAKLDYFAAQLKSRGIYYGWSHAYHFKVRPANKSRIAGYDELMKNGGDTYGVINWAEDVQDLLIEQVVGLLHHKNPYTGTAYADDPALCFLELQNEDDIFFYTSTDACNNFPTYKKLLLKRFAEFLTAQYGSREKLAAAWQGALKDGENLADATIEVQPNPWYESDQYLPGQSGGMRQRLLDNAAFLHETQNRFYAKFSKAIRDAGYKGPIIGSPWQAPTMLPHYLNLQADAQAGFVDRHDYFGGGLNDTMLKDPGGGFLSAGLQQVAGVPFGLSEWIHVYPSLYSAEGPVIAAAYGMGLQGWDSSYEFQSTSAHPAESVGNEPFGVWNADLPTQIGQYPILARMIQRGDVKESPIIATRRVSPENLAQGRFDFNDALTQQGDFKTFASPEVLAAGRAVVEFTGKTSTSTLPNLDAYKKGSVITSATGQLAWDASAGVISINTPGTQGIVGFARDNTLTLGDISITSHSPYASILLTAKEKNDVISSGKTLLLSAVARNANSGFRVLTIDGKTILDNGHAPIMLEPVSAEISFKSRKIKQVQILDLDGNLTSRTAAFTPEKFTIDGKNDRAIYYQIVLE